MRDVWYAPEFEALSTDAKLIYFHLCSTPSGHHSGLYYVRKIALADELGMDLERYEKGFAEVFIELSLKGLPKSYLNPSERVFGVYCPHSKTAFLPQFLDVSFAMNPNVLKQWANHAASLPHSFIKTVWIGCIALQIEARELGEGFRKGFMEGFGKEYLEGFGKEFPKPFGKGSFFLLGLGLVDIFNSLCSLNNYASQPQCVDEEPAPIPSQPPAPVNKVTELKPDAPIQRTRKGKILTGKRLEQFEMFWAAFDYRKGKSDAADAWLAIGDLDDDTFQLIIAAAHAEATLRPGMVQQNRTPKMAQGWLSGRRWEDDYGQLMGMEHAQAGTGMGAAERIRAYNESVENSDEPTGFIDAEYTARTE